LELPEVDEYLPTEDGAPPLGRAPNWAWDTVNHKVVSNELLSPSGRDVGGEPTERETVFPLELNTMPGWAGSSWYFLKYMYNTTEDGSVPKEALDYWQNVDLYIGGSEHATGHLLYSRFWTKFLHDLEMIQPDEPFKKLINQGMILGTSAIIYRISGSNKYVSKGLKDKFDTEELRVDVNMVNSSDELDLQSLSKWQPQFKDAQYELENDKYIVGREVEKMSKRWFNVVNPDDICNQYGADTLRMYEMFLGPLEQAKPWNTAGITGVHSFLKKLWKLYHSGENGTFKVTEDAASKESLKTLHKTIKKVEEDIENFSFNTSVSTFMIAVNELTSQKCHSKEVLEPLAILISPYAPHIAEELWYKLGKLKSIATAPFPVFDANHLVESSK
ncbi:MAG: class I tRNA ligase family protein, partial [Bacteroidota bacterium]